MDYGVLSLLPILVVLVLALATKRTLEPLIVGTVTAYIIINGPGFATGWMDAFFTVASDRSWYFV